MAFPLFDKRITVHHLLTHTSGIPDYFDEEVMEDYEDLWKTVPMYTILSPKDFLPLFQDRPMKSPPGERFSYNNAGFILLGLIVEQAAGMDFTTYVERHIFGRCGMKDSGYFRMDQLPERTAVGYLVQEQGWRTNAYSVPIKGGPDGGAFTTVTDFEKFWNALFENRLLSPAFTNLLLTPHAAGSGNRFYGYGIWMLKRDDRIFKYYVMGSDPGVTMHSAVYVDSKIQAHILGNQNRGAGAIANGIDSYVMEQEARE